MKNSNKVNHFSPKNEILVILFHAYMSSPSKLKSMVDTVKSNISNADIYTPKLPLSYISFASPQEIINQQLTEIDTIVKKSISKDRERGYEKIIIVGHSYGALLARALYVDACTLEEENELPKYQWCSKIDRIILFAGMNRGWRISHHLSILNAILWSMGSVLSGVIWLLSGKSPQIYAIKKGSPFITNLRIRWIKMRNMINSSKVGNALTIQLLGTIDDMVSPEDNIDLVAGSDFIYIDVPHSGHANVIDMAHRKYGGGRKKVFEQALLKNNVELKKLSQIPSDDDIEEKNYDVTDVVFVMHGIRDLGYWTHKVARRIIKRSYLLKKKHKIIATETSSYGYFPMLSFISPFKRRDKVAWLMDQYAEALARYPNADFSYVGHSNGTYLLAKALTDYPLSNFKNVVFAGSVVRKDYDWNRVLESGQVNKVLNFVASSDWIVGFFPNSIQKLNWQDLGSAGHDGFDYDENPNIHQIKYISGAHGAALQEDNWDTISDFVLTGEITPVPQSIMQKNQSFIVKYLAMISPVVFFLLAAFICLGYWIVLQSQYSDVIKTLILGGLTFVIWKILTKI